ncbi:hypothetical protein BgiMline_017872, partial [Biomphalaria glabrata]
YVPESKKWNFTMKGIDQAVNNEAQIVATFFTSNEDSGIYLCSIDALNMNSFYENNFKINGSLVVRRTKDHLGASSFGKRFHLAFPELYSEVNCSMYTKEFKSFKDDDVVHFHLSCHLRCLPSLIHRLDVPCTDDGGGGSCRDDALRPVSFQMTLAFMRHKYSSWRSILSQVTLTTAWYSKEVKPVIYMLENSHPTNAILMLPVSTQNVYQLRFTYILEAEYEFQVMCYSLNSRTVPHSVMMAVPVKGFGRVFIVPSIPFQPSVQVISGEEDLSVTVEISYTTKDGKQVKSFLTQKDSKGIIYLIRG